ncbi:histidine phosphatase family protein [Massilia endophytica]|uniref:histidine phosphatase family protein n=1 Tax=Massilia endophytica TaxID=2899220 RepID=UPI001E363939|nr:histidine phosphatase family protein [Massilia endophytica]UGQ47724.1 histidine phosphatase family protein [Massilia endophytica]
MELILIRHPRPAGVEGRCYGSSDVAVEAGELARCADAVQGQLALLVPVSTVQYFSSPLQRCSALAQLLSPDFRSDARIAEMHFGGWEGQRWEAIPRAEVDAWVADLPGFRPGGGENVAEVAQRVNGFLHDLRRSGCERTVVVCHAGTMRLMQALAGGQTPAAAALNAAATPHRIAYGEVLSLPLSGKPV